MMTFRVNTQFLAFLGFAVLLSGCTHHHPVAEMAPEPMKPMPASASGEMSASQSMPAATAMGSTGGEMPQEDDGTEMAKPVAGVGHSKIGHVFDEGPRQQAKLLEGMPKVNFPISCTGPDSQEFFNQGVGQLHGFWNYEAERSFRQILVKDPDCAMAYWGMAQANTVFDAGDTKRARGFVKKMLEKRGFANEREKMWIDALAAFHDMSEKDGKKRAANYVSKLKEIMDADSDDIEAKAFYVLEAWHREQDVSTSKLSALLDEVFRISPMHPAHHYKIHVWNGKDGNRGLESAGIAGLTGPGIAHLWHMAGHTLSELNRHIDRAWYQEASARVDHEHMVRTRTMPYEIHNYFHNNEWLTRTLVQTGAITRAIGFAVDLIDQPRHPVKNNAAAKDGDYSSQTFGQLRLINALAEAEAWQKLLDYSEEGGDLAVVPKSLEMTRSATLAVAAYELKKLDRGDEYVKEIETTRDALDDDNEKRGVNQLIEALRAVRALNADSEDAVKKAALVVAIDSGMIPKTLLSQQALRLGDSSRAENLARLAVEASPNAVIPLANQVDVLWQTGQADRAIRKLRFLSTLASNVSEKDLTYPPFLRLSLVAQSPAALATLPKGWNLSRPPVSEFPLDLPNRPALDDISKHVYWEPSQAPELELKRWEDGSTFSLAGELKAKPERAKLVTFFLGGDCVLCVEQLQELKKVAAEFKEAGIDVITVSTDGADRLKEVVPVTGEYAYPFPILPDAERIGFKAFHAYDEFEGIALHGTYLIDGKQRIRWQDTGSKPYMDFKFLLEEAKRLLSRPI